MPSGMEDVRLEASKTYAIVFTNNGHVLYRDHTDAITWETWVRNCKMKKDMEYEFVRNGSPRIREDGKVDSDGLMKDIRPQDDDLIGLTIQELRKIAASEGVSVKGGKELIIAAIRESRTSSALGASHAGLEETRA